MGPWSPSPGAAVQRAQPGVQRDLHATSHFGTLPAGGFITAALDAGVPLRDVQEATSHADPRSTMRYDRARTSLGCEMTGYHTRWARPEDAADDPERSASREALSFGKALCDIHTAECLQSRGHGS